MTLNSTPPRPTRTSRAWGGAQRERGRPGRGVHNDQVLPGRQGSGARGRAEPAPARLDQVDLYLVHWPQGGPTWAWPSMERARELGYARSIGISNFAETERPLERYQAPAGASGAMRTGRRVCDASV